MSLCSTFISHEILFERNLTQYGKWVRDKRARTIAAQCRAIRFASLELINITAFPRECVAVSGN